MGGGGSPGDVRTVRDNAKKAKPDPVKTPVVDANTKTPVVQSVGCLCCAAGMTCAVHALMTARISPVVEAVGLELHAAVNDGDTTKIIEVLERNAKPEKMSTLHREYGASFIADLRDKLSEQEWARARVYLGTEVPFDLRIDTHDDASILQDIDALSDDEALAMFAAPPRTSWLPPTSMFDRVQEVLAQHNWIGNDTYFTAIRKLIEKAQRGLDIYRQQDPLRQLLEKVFGLALPDPYQVDDEGLDPVAHARVDLIVARVAHTAGRAYNTGRGPGAIGLAFAALEPGEIDAVASRLAKETGGVIVLGREVPFPSQSAEAIRQAIEAEGKEAGEQDRAVDAAGVNGALARAAALIRDAKQRRDALLAKQEQRDDAERAGEEVPAETFDPDDPYPLSSAKDRLKSLTETFFKRPLSADYKRALAGTFGSFAEGLRAMGADGVTVGIALMDDLWWPNPYSVIDRLRQIDPADRLDVMIKSGMLQRLADWPMLPDTRELLRAYIWEDRSGDDAKLLLPDPISPELPQDQAQVPAGFEGFAEPIPGQIGASPKSIIALNEVLDAMDKGPKAAAWVLARLERLTKEQRAALFAEPRFESKLESLPDGDEKSDDRDFKDALKMAANGNVEYAIAHYPGPAGPWQSVALEDVRVKAESIGRAQLRRAFVLQHRIMEDASYAAQLSPTDRLLLDQLSEIRSANPLFDTDEQRTAVDEIAFGQPQLIDTPEAALDPNVEAEFMRARLRAAVGLAPGQRLSDWSHKDANPVIETFTAFELLYEQQRPGGFSKDKLPALAELYYRALDAYQAWKAENERSRSEASTAAMLVGMAVAAVVVSFASGGTLTPLAVGALASVSAGAASVATGLLIRHESSVGDVLRDFGTGAVEGALAVASEALAAKIIARAARGMTAGRIAVEAGAEATAKATGRAGSHIVKAILEGAIGGAGGDLFQTAIDEATWDKGIARAFAKMLLALGRGAVVGATLGGVLVGAGVGLGKLYKKAGALARRIGQWFEAARIGTEVLDALSDHELEQLIEATKLIEQGNLKEAEHVIERIEGLAGRSKRALRAVARARVAMETVGDIGAADLEGTSLFPHMLEEKEFRKLAKLTGNQRRDAMIIIENGQPRIVMREGAPPQALREEIVHLQQWNTDIAQRARMRNLSEETFAKANWEALPTVKKLELHLDKLEVEADAQRRIIDRLSTRPESDVAAARQVADADETLYLIEEKLAKLRKAKGEGEAAMKALDVDEVPRLYAAGEQTTHTPAGKSPLEGLDLSNPEDVKKLRKAGYRVTTPSESRAGRIARDPSRKGELLQLRVADDGKTTEKVTKVRATFQDELARAPGRWEAEEQRVAKLKLELESGALTPEEATRARVALDRGSKFRAALERRIYSLKNPMDKTTAGLLMKWGPVIDELNSRFPHLNIDDLIAKIGKIAKQGEVDDFRRVLRTRIVDEALGVGDPEKRVESLLAMVDVQPESASRGHLFDEFGQKLMNRDPNSALRSAGQKPPPFFQPGFKATRQPDDVIEVATNSQKIRPGTYLGEYKAGEGAFKIDQLEDLAKLWDGGAKGFKRAATDTDVAYKGEIFFFSEQRWAKNAREDIANSLGAKHLLDGDPPGVILMYLDPKTSQFRRYVGAQLPTPTAGPGL